MSEKIRADAIIEIRGSANNGQQPGSVRAIVTDTRLMVVPWDENADDLMDGEITLRRGEIELLLREAINHGR